MKKNDNNEVLKRKQITKQIMDICANLPDCCDTFFTTTGMSMAASTRLAYARELDWFFDYLIENCEYFYDKQKKTITIDDIKNITSEDISRYITMFRDLGRMERTLARKRAALSRFFTYLTDNRRIPFNPVIASEKVKVHQSDTVTYLDINEQIKFINAVETGETLTDKQKKYHNKYKLRDTALILLLLDTGMRVSELQGINLHDVDFDNCSIIITRKGGNISTIYFSDEAKEPLYEYYMYRKNIEGVSGADALFTSAQGIRLSVRAIEKLVKKYATATLPGKGNHISPHKMRSSFAMTFYEETKDILALQRKLGHKSIAVTNIYAKATDKKMKETRNVLPPKRK